MKRPIRRWVFAVPLFLICIALLALGTCDARKKAAYIDLTQSLLRLERALRYAGFIQHYKDYVFQPGESKYYHLAKSGQIAAVAQLDHLDIAPRKAAIPVDISVLRKMVVLNGQVLERVSAMAEKGLGSTEIDQRTRIPDDAIATLANEMALLELGFQNAMTQARDLARLWNWIGFAALIVELLAFIALLMAQIDQQ